MLSLTSSERQPVGASRSSHWWSSSLVVALAITVATVSMTTASVQQEVNRHDITVPKSDVPSSAVELVLGSSRGMHVEQNDEDDTDVDDEVVPEKRKAGRFTSFRSDLGKRRVDSSDIDDTVNDDVKRAVYRMRGGKAFKADLGKRPASSGRGMTLFRSDLGKRSIGDVASEADDWEDVVVGGSEAEPEMEMDVERRAGRMLPMFRSDLGKRVLLAAPARGESIRRMFRADLGKRARSRVPFRHDLG